VILCGGLGPTEDDMTKEIAAEVMGKALYEDPHSIEMIKGYMNNHLRSNPNAKITSNNWKQALIPEGAMVLDNANGTAPGIIMEENGKIVILLPGPPNELKPMFELQVYPYLKEKQPELIHSKILKVTGIGESLAETKLLDLIDGQTNPTIATYAKTCEVHVRITATAKSIEEAEEIMEPVISEIESRFGSHIYSKDENESLEECIVKILNDRCLTLSTAESCSGGMLSSRIINVSGVSNVYKEGFITYSNEAKHKNLGVSEETLRAFGAVSKETAIEMVQGCAKAADSDTALAVTGIAGPEGGTPEKPVGLVYISCYNQGKVYVQELRLNGNRAKIREQATAKALILLRDCLVGLIS
jgi:nicotinamide-nucleotide amidase